MRMSTRVGLTEVQMAWSTTPLSLLNTYRVSHNLSTPAAFTSPLNQALLVNPGIGRQSPTMARRKDKRRVSREQLATNVRKHFNGAAVNEIDVVVELVYKSRNKGKRHSASCKSNTRLTPHRQGISHALSARYLQEDMTDACTHARRRFTASTRSLHTLDTTRHRRRFPCCIRLSIAFGHTDEDIGDWTGVGFRLCCLHIIASIQGMALRHAYS
jgi:transcription elongation factor Elf1